MGQPDYRGGKAPLRTATELALLLPVPIMMIVDGYAQVVFPTTDRSNPSTYVAIVPTKPKKGYPPATRLPIYVHWTQWENVVVPLFQSDDRLTGWRGTLAELGQAIMLMNNIVGPNGEILFPIGLQIGLGVPSDQSLGRLYACDPFDSQRYGGKTGGYLTNAMGVIFTKAQEAGY